MIAVQLRQGFIGRDYLHYFCFLLSAAVLSFIFCADAVAIDGNYSSPYASQYDSRSIGARIPNETLVGVLLLMFNVLAVAYFTLRDKFRRRRQTI